MCRGRRDGRCRVWGESVQVVHGPLSSAGWRRATLAFMASVRRVPAAARSSPDPSRRSKRGRRSAVVGLRRMFRRGHGARDEARARAQRRGRRSHGGLAADRPRARRPVALERRRGLRCVVVARVVARVCGPFELSPIDRRSLAPRDAGHLSQLGLSQLGLSVLPWSLRLFVVSSSLSVSRSVTVVSRPLGLSVVSPRSLLGLSLTLSRSLSPSCSLSHSLACAASRARRRS